jgi:4-hydroxymandelate oxidase
MYDDQPTNGNGSRTVQPVTLEEYESYARGRVPADAWDFVHGGSGAEWTLAANLAQFDGWALRPRVLADVSACDLSARILGADLAAPLGVAPMAYHRLMHPEGEAATARAAGGEGALFVLSIFSSTRLEEVAAAAEGPLWLQLYWMRAPGVLEDLVGRAEAAGFRALVLTVDAPRVARRPRDVRNSFTLPPDVSAVNIDPAAMAAGHRRVEAASAIETHARDQFKQPLTWDDLAQLRAMTSLPIVLKGILTGEDARLAARHGADAVIVSNHGGRQLDGAIPTLAALPEVAAAVPPGFPVLFDGGVRRGTDVLKALALGAHTVLLGRPVLWGLAHAGAAGARDVLRIVRDQLEEAMILSGTPALADIGPGLVTPWPPRAGR